MLTFLLENSSNIKLSLLKFFQFFYINFKCSNVFYVSKCKKKKKKRKNQIMHAVFLSEKKYKIILRIRTTIPIIWKDCRLTLR